MLPRRQLRIADVPALGFALSGLLGVIGALFLALSNVQAVWLATVLTCLAILSLLFVANRSVGVIAVYFAISSIVLLRGTSDIGREEREALVNHDSDTATVTCRGVVVWRDEGSQNARTSRVWLADVRLGLPDTTLSFETVRLRMSIPVLAALPIGIGDVIAGNVRLECANHIQRRSVRELLWTLRERLCGTAKLVDEESLVIVPGRWSFRESVYGVRRSILEILEEHLQPDARAVASALLLGAREAFSPEFREDLQITGLAHLFALSGMNTGLLVSLFWLVMGWMRVPRHMRYLLLLVLLLFYGALGLGVPSLFRSSVMAGLIVISRLLSRDAHPVNLLLFAAGAELLMFPLHVLDAGFHLSYLSMAGILAAYQALDQPLQDLLKWNKSTLGRRAVDTLASTVGAQLATAPAAALMFGRIPGLAILFNIVAIPLFSLLVVLVLLLIAIDPVSGWATAALSRSIEALVGVFGGMTSAAASFSGASVMLRSAPLWPIAAGLLQLVAITMSFAGRKQNSLVFTLVAINLLIWPAHFARTAEVRVAAVGQGEIRPTYFKVGSWSGLANCGTDWNSERTAMLVSDLLEHDGRSTLDFLIIDSRSALENGGAPRVIEKLKPAITIDWSPYRDTRTSALIDAALVMNNGEVVDAAVGQSWRCGSTDLSVLEVSRISAGSPWIVEFAGDVPRVTIQKTRQDALASSNVCTLAIDAPEAQICIPIQNEEFHCVHDNGQWTTIKSPSISLMNLWNLPDNTISS